MVLSCKLCNNTAGTVLDSSLIDHMKESQFLSLKPYGQINVKVTLNRSEPLPAKLQIGKNKEWIFKLNTKNPKAKAYMEDLKENWNGSQMNVQFNTTRNDLIINALLRIGYLYAFGILGYLPLFEKNIHRLIEQISKPKERLLPHSSVSELNLENNAEDGLYIIRQPADYRSYISIFKIKLDNYIRQFGVYIPGPGEESWNSYSNLAGFTKRTDFQFTNINHKNIVLRKDLVDGYTHIWNYFK